ncbi:aminoacyl-tRNA hydrolase [Roseovarius sp. ZX-A-9]|uniref:aminoacyl-tRNA hydrolase n=1 Tax=Roseovarius sp. ZX-A-9 TaxID=3014783 RepID=UPI00232BB83A|nr:aminoacyl-tRNA hydrolase [Roseovarius sp. ZX-A-9]
MLIFAGLGNPGAKYARNRHNIGFMAVDRIAEDHGFGPWKARFQGQVSEGRLGSQKVLLLKPETFMNLSGQAVGEAMRFYKLEPGDVTVLHDEIDLAPGKLRVKTGGGHAGHNGLRSIHQHIGPDYARVRIGVGHPGRKEAVPGYVLHDFPKADENWLEDILRGISDGAPYLAEGDAGRFQNAVALRTAPPRASSSKPGAKSGEKSDPKAPSRAKEPPAPQSEPEADAEPRSPLQRLVDRFR